MKIFLVVVCCCLIACTQANKNAPSNKRTSNVTSSENAAKDANMTSIQWIDSTFQDLGKIHEGQVVEITWKFKNIGNKPLVIESASASCGCTVAERPEQPVAPGDEGTIKAKFDSKGRVGEQRKQVYVVTNTSDREHDLSFRVEVFK
ncbi:MAG: DUF1573 domain-containing protein [Chitinophagaceae bacterium]|nr:DUF1573 domain-containing protein [Chitinophagaceae bacterium]